MIPDLNDPTEIEGIIKDIDPTVRLWDFVVPGLSHKRREFDFISEDFQISIIDQFRGIIPALISRETVIENHLLALAPTVILDSNVMASLHQFVAAPEKMADKHRKVIVQLLDFLLLEKLDYNPAFYYLESFSKATDADYKIIDYTKSILTLHMMDELHFLQKREICTDNATLEKYTKKFGTSDVAEMARLQCKHLKDGYVPGTDWKVMYLIIIKAALIQQTRNASFQFKMKELNDFIYSTFGVLFSRELAIAAFYFSGDLDKFIPLQKGSNYEGVIKKLRATAWDLYLLRLPELFLCQENPPIPLTVICTGDKALQSIGRKFRIRRLYTSKGIPTPELEMEFFDISNPSSKNGEMIFKLFNEYKLNREARRRGFDSEQVLGNLDGVISGLELSVKNFCKAKE